MQTNVYLPNYLDIFLLSLGNLSLENSQGNYATYTSNCLGIGELKGLSNNNTYLGLLHKLPSVRGQI